MSESHRVRFSQDVERQDAAAERDDGTIASRIASAEAEGEDRDSGSRSRLSSQDVQVNPERATSPRARDRGYSLRRALFTRTVTQRSDVSAGVDAASSQSGSTLQPDREARVLEEEGVVAKPQQPPTDRASHGSGKSETESSTSDAKREAANKANGKDALPGLYSTWSKRRSTGGDLKERLLALQSGAATIIFRRKPIPPSKDGRHIALDASRKDDFIDERTNKPYINNTIRSSRYTIWDFIPRQLFFQFSKLANAYFLIVGILQLIPGLSTIGSWTTIAPLAVFVTLSMAKEGWDDVRRYRLDQVENRKVVCMIPLNAVLKLCILTIIF